MRSSSYLTIVALAGLSLAGCDRLKALLPDDGAGADAASAVAEGNISRAYDGMAAVEAAQLPLHADLAKREGDVLTVSWDGKAIARFHSHGGACVDMAPPCGVWRFNGVVDLTDSATGQLAPFAVVARGHEVDQATNVDWPEFYLVDHDGRIYFAGSETFEPLVSPRHDRFVTQGMGAHDWIGLTIVDWTAAGQKDVYMLSTLFWPREWRDDTRISVQEIPNEGIINGVLSRQADGVWSLHETEFIDERYLDYSREGGYTPKPDAVHEPRLGVADEVAVKRNVEADMVAMTAQGYTRLTP